MDRISEVEKEAARRWFETYASPSEIQLAQERLQAVNNLLFPGSAYLPHQPKDLTDDKSDST